MSEKHALIGAAHLSWFCWTHWSHVSCGGAPAEPPAPAETGPQSVLPEHWFEHCPHSAHVRKPVSASVAAGVPLQPFVRPHATGSGELRHPAFCRHCASWKQPVVCAHLELSAGQPPVWMSEKTQLEQPLGPPPVPPEHWFGCVGQMPWQPWHSAQLSRLTAAWTLPPGALQPAWFAHWTGFGDCSQLVLRTQLTNCWHCALHWACCIPQAGDLIVPWTQLVQPAGPPPAPPGPTQLSPHWYVPFGPQLHWYEQFGCPGTGPAQPVPGWHFAPG